METLGGPKNIVVDGGPDPPHGGEGDSTWWSPVFTVVEDCDLSSTRLLFELRS